MKRIVLALVALGALALAGCQTSQTTSTGWGQIATGVGAVIGETKIDPKIEKVSAKLAGYCAEAQTAALAVDLFAPEKLQEAASAGRITVATFCAAPPKSVAEALVALAHAIAAIEAARQRG
jgi:predicted small secreted protein